MGRWGVGNFESDSAAEWMHEELEHDLVAQLRETVADPALCEAGEPSAEALLCALEVLTLITKRLHHVLPSRDEIRNWKGAYLESWDATADDCWPSPDNLKKRRKVIVRTFEQAIRASSPDPDWTSAQTKKKPAKKKPAKKKPAKKKPAKKKPAKKKPTKKKPAGWQHYEFHGPKSAKFWAVRVAGSSLTTHWGRIGAKGQQKVKKLASPAAAREALEKLVAQKTNKGYSPIQTPKEEAAKKSR